MRFFEAESALIFISNEKHHFKENIYVSQKLMYLVLYSEEQMSYQFRRVQLSIRTKLMDQKTGTTHVYIIFFILVLNS